MNMLNIFQRLYFLATCDYFNITHENKLYYLEDYKGLKSYITKVFGETLPIILVIKGGFGDVGGFYDYISKIIYITEDSVNGNGYSLLKCVAHELTHWYQQVKLKRSFPWFAPKPSDYYLPIDFNKQAKIEAEAEIVAMYVVLSTGYFTDNHKMSDGSIKLLTKEDLGVFKKYMNTFMQFNW